MDSHGRLYFVDPVKQNIYRYLPVEKRLEVVRDNPIDAANLFFDRSDNMMVRLLCWTGTVYSLKPDDPADTIQVLKAQPATARPGLTRCWPSITGASTMNRARISGGGRSPGSTFHQTGVLFCRRVRIS